MALSGGDMLRLSRVALGGHKKRNRLVVLTIVTLFFMIFIVSIIYQGLENTIIDASASNTGGIVYIKTGFIQDYYYHKDYGRLTSQHLPENTEAIITERIKQYHGEIIGRVSDISNQQEWKYNVISLSAVEDFIDNYDTMTKIAVIKSKDDNGSLAEDFQILGTYPSTARGRIGSQNIFFDPVLEQINPSPQEIFVIDDGSKEFLEYINHENEIWREIRGYNYDPTPVMFYVVKFNNARDAAKYYSNLVLDGIKYGYNLSSGYRYEVKDLFNNTISVAMSFTFYQIIMLVLLVVFIVFAFWITVLTFAHIADEDVATIALYRSMGARTFDIYLIYGLYLLELCMISLAICMLLTLAVAGIVFTFSAQNLVTALQEFYQIATTPRATFVGINGIIVLAMFAMIVTVPITMLLLSRKFSAKQIAQKLKER